MRESSCPGLSDTAHDLQVTCNRLTPKGDVPLSAENKKKRETADSMGQPVTWPGEDDRNRVVSPKENKDVAHDSITVTFTILGQRK